MRLLKRLLLALALMAAATAIFPAHAQSYRLGDGSVEQGGTARVSISITGLRSSPSFVLFYTGAPADTAKPGIDYAPVAQIFRVLPTDTKLSIDVPTLKNDSVPGPSTKLSTKLIVLQGGTLLDGTGQILIPDSDVAMQTCWDNSVIPETSACPVRPTQTCWNGDVIFADLQCPVRPTQQCWDGSVIFADLACPVRPTKPCWDGTTIFADLDCPVQPPPPPVEQLDPDPTVGLKAIPSNGPLAIHAAGIPQLQPVDVYCPSGATCPPSPFAPKEVVGAYRFICGAGQLRYDDPIVYPKQPGKAHLHQFYGNTSADANSTHASLRASGDSTCNIAKAGSGKVPANRSAYWMPAMLDGKGFVVMPDYFQVYYKREPDTYPAGTPLAAIRRSICDLSNPAGVASWGGKCVAIPNGLRFIAGFDQVNGKAGVQPGNFKCVTAAGAGGAVYPDMTKLAADPKCVPGSKVEASIQSLKCWNGKLDSPNHMDHLAAMVSYASGKGCPRTHPYLLPQFTQSAFYSINSGDDLNLWQLSSDKMWPNLPKGATLHFDYFEAWDAGVKNGWTVPGCIGRFLNCSAGNNGDGTALDGADSGTVGTIAKTFPHRVPVPANDNGPMAMTGTMP